ncbi:Riboflavin synthase alpha chain [Candidatus Hodgkinia cicadicola]|uniref:Riboflavin synthase alpha chain n=1 Tax=Candidatus Hodgkinia cicadicola TaxID=573658 RepID=A0ABX4MFR2_9HYPH|nr:Riboflavin synthase alpha chain [Candidatus Hodgkinia cicadicola]
MGLLTTSDHYKLIKTIQNGCNSEQNNVCTPTNQYTLTGLDKTHSMLANVSPLSDDDELSIISESESKVRSLVNKSGIHLTVTEPNTHDLEALSGGWRWFGLTRLQRSDMSDPKTTIVFPTPLHANITNDNCKSVINVNETYKQGSGIILVIKHESLMINKTIIRNSIGLDGTIITTKYDRMLFQPCLTNLICNKKYFIKTLQ